MVPCWTLYLWNFHRQSLLEIEIIFHKLFSILQAPFLLPVPYSHGYPSVSLGFVLLLVNWKEVCFIIKVSGFWTLAFCWLKSDNLLFCFSRQCSTMRSPYTGISHFLPSTRKIVQFAEGKEPQPSDKIVYCPGSFDLFRILLCIVDMNIHVLTY